MDLTPRQDLSRRRTHPGRRVHSCRHLTPTVLTGRSLRAFGGDAAHDCRFIFVRPRDRYLSLFPERDVIETPLDEVFDVNGWDLAKRLLERFVDAQLTRAEAFEDAASLRDPALVRSLVDQYFVSQLGPT